MRRLKNTLTGGLVLLFSLLCFTGFAQQPAKPQTHTVEIVHMKFQPAELRAKKGDKVIFINKDMVTHNVTEQAKQWKSPDLAAGKSWTMEVKKDVSYFCSFHPVMKGKISIK